MQLRFHRVRVRALGTALPETEITSLDIERRLAPAYERLGLAEGRLELMTGIAARRHFTSTLPSEIATRAAEDLLRKVPEAREKIDTLIHAAVCRDYLEPATAAVVHSNLRLPDGCLVFDLSDACLSGINALAVAAGLIESGQSRAALVVTGEDARSVVDTTIAKLNADLTLTRKSLKPSLATLTLGSGGVAVLLTGDGPGAPLLGGAFQAATRFHSLCRGGEAAESTTAAVTMETDSETMLHEGVALAARTWWETRKALGWGPGAPAAFVTHQVGGAHRKLLHERLELDPAKDFSTFPTLGNMGAASIGVTLAEAARAGALPEGGPVALLGIGSGLVCGMMGLRWTTEVAA